MSATDPKLRLYRRPWVKPVVRGTLWSIAGLAAFLAACFYAVKPGPGSSWTTALVVAYILAMVSVGVSDAETEDPQRKPYYVWPYILWGFGLFAVCAGAGTLLGGLLHGMVAAGQDPRFESSGIPVPVGVLLLVAGVALLAGSVWARKRRGILLQRMWSVELTGPKVPAAVTDVRRATTEGGVYYKVTVRFTDSQGIARWHTARAFYETPQVGSQHWIRYDPDAPGRKSTLFVEWAGRTS